MSRARPCSGCRGLFGKSVRIRPGTSLGSKGEHPGVPLTDHNIQYVLQLNSVDSHSFTKAIHGSRASIACRKFVLQQRRCGIPRLHPNYNKRHLHIRMPRIETRVTAHGAERDGLFHFRAHRDWCRYNRQGRKAEDRRSSVHHINRGNTRTQRVRNTGTCNQPLHLPRATL